MFALLRDNVLWDMTVVALLLVLVLDLFVVPPSTRICCATYQRYLAFKIHAHLPD